MSKISLIIYHFFPSFSWLVLCEREKICYSLFRYMGAYERVEKVCSTTACVLHRNLSKCNSAKQVGSWTWSGEDEKIKAPLVVCTSKKLALNIYGTTNDDVIEWSCEFFMQSLSYALTLSLSLWWWNHSEKSFKFLHRRKFIHSWVFLSISLHTCISPSNNPSNFCLITLSSSILKLYIVW